MRRGVLCALGNSGKSSAGGKWDLDIQGFPGGQGSAQPGEGTGRWAPIPPGVNPQEAPGLGWGPGTPGKHLWSSTTLQRMKLQKKNGAVASCFKHKCHHRYFL